DEGLLYVVDSENKRVQLFNLDDNYKYVDKLEHPKFTRHVHGVFVGAERTRQPLLEVALRGQPFDMVGDQFGNVLVSVSDRRCVCVFSHSLAAALYTVRLQTDRSDGAAVVRALPLSAATEPDNADATADGDAGGNGGGSDSSSDDDDTAPLRRLLGGVARAAGKKPLIHGLAFHPGTGRLFVADTFRSAWALQSPASGAAFSVKSLLALESPAAEQRKEAAMTAAGPPEPRLETAASQWCPSSPPPPSLSPEIPAAAPVGAEFDRATESEVAQTWSQGEARTATNHSGEAKFHTESKSSFSRTRSPGFEALLEEDLPVRTRKSKALICFPNQQTMAFAVRSLLLLLLLLTSLVAAQRRLSEDEMKSVINLQEYRDYSPPSHECQYLVKPSDAYSGRGGGSTDKFFLECCGGRQFPICGGLTRLLDIPGLLKFRLSHPPRRPQCELPVRLLPRFRRFENINGRSNCSQRLLADRELPDWLAQLPGSRVGGFSDAFASSPQVEGVLMTGRPNNGTWTLLALVDEAFDDNDFLAFTSCSNGTLSKVYRRQTTAAPGRAGMSAPKEKIAEGSRGHRSLIYQQKCRELEASNATGSLDFRLEAWKHLIPGRKYIADLQREAVVPSMFKMDSGESYPLKFSKYSNGVEHSVQVSRRNAWRLLESRFPDFWSLMPEPSGSCCGQSSCDAFYTVLVPKQLDSLRALSGEQRSAALREHIVKGLWCTAGMIDRETQPVATVSTESVRFACSASSARQVLFGPKFSRRATVSSAAGEFDIMAVNGVLQVVDAPILPKDALSLRTALQLEEAEPPGEDSVASEPENLSAGLVRECFLNFQEGESYIVLLPTDEAFRKFFTQRNIPEAVGFHDSAEIRCALLRHHVLAAGAASRASAGRPTCSGFTAAWPGPRADYLFVKNGVP
uniref:FAS1 domain-containing protein n=1 Tax=Macrostomum lignano TaxID=282301 RepID=A0A1I8F287_9PLAT